MIRKNSIRALLGVNISKSRPVTMLRARPHAIDFKPILDFGEECVQEKADMFSRRWTYRGKSQKPVSLGRISGG
jgi:hypothetical protein